MATLFGDIPDRQKTKTFLPHRFVHNQGGIDLRSAQNKVTKNAFANYTE